MRKQDALLFSTGCLIPVYATYRTYFLLPLAVLPYAPVDVASLAGPRFYKAETPVSLSHYWMSGRPVVLMPYSVCLD